MSLDKINPLIFFLVMLVLSILLPGALKVLPLLAFAIWMLPRN